VKDDAKVLYEIVLFAPKALLVFQANKSQPRISLALDTALSQPNNSSSHPGTTTALPLLKTFLSSGTAILKILLIMENLLYISSTDHVPFKTKYTAMGI
jgi:hypothetical protein